MRIYVSGLHSGTNPQPGIGIARSLRAAYPQATLVGVEYSSRSSGIHWTDFDEIWLQRPWGELSLPGYLGQIRELLDDGALWLCGLDLEIMLLTGELGGHPRLLVPSSEAMNAIAKPAVPAHRGLPVEIPPFLSTEHPDWDLHAFCRRRGWRVWLKGPYYEARRVYSWPAFNAARQELSRTWATERLFLQAHASGYEETVALSAYRGELLGCVRMRKRDMTEESKTWAGDVSEVAPEFSEPLRRIVRDLEWTGGAELEMVRDLEGGLWLIEWNPRFPAWIHGSTLAGTNLVGALVEAATGEPARRTEAVSREFSRVVLEVPVRPGFPLPSHPEPRAGAFGHSLKHPSGLSVLAERLHGSTELVGENARKAAGNGRPASRRNGKHRGVPGVPTSFLEDLQAQDPGELQTPAWLFFERTAAELFARAAAEAQRLGSGPTRVVNAYSIKTNPDSRLLGEARRAGFLAEAISLLEVQKALSVGYRPEEVVLNGPGKWWPSGELPSEPLHAVFCDSVADLERVVAAARRNGPPAQRVGVRLRTPHVASRFGIPIDRPEAFAALVEGIGLLPEEIPFGIHFHMASSNIGVDRWWHLYDSMLRWCAAIERVTRRRVECLDLGGGWFPDDWEGGFDGRLEEATLRAREALPHVDQILFEPGKALAQPTMALAMRVLEVHRSHGEVEDAVVDGSIAELAVHYLQPHRILHRDRRSGQWKPLARGSARLLGRLCMEDDIVATDVDLPGDVDAGDVLVICDAGGYDRSMSYVFGRG
jgi:diaminopimelate decarboxylase